MSKVLIIDNNKFTLTTLESEFHQENIEIIFSNGENGLIKTKEEEPDLIILEILLPRKNGFEILEELKKNPVLKNIPVVIYSVLQQKSDIQKALELGAIDYFTKNKCSSKEIVKKVIEYLQKKIK